MYKPKLFITIILLYAIFYHSLRIYLIDNELITIFFVGMSSFFIIHYSRPITYEKFSSLFFVVLLFYFISIPVSLIYQNSFYSIIRGLFIFPFYLFFIFIGKFIIRHNLSRYIANLTIIAALISACYGVYQYFFGSTYMEYLYSLRSSANYGAVYGTINLVRSYGFQGGPADYSAFLMIAIIFSFFYIENAIIKIVTISIMFIGQMFSLTRGPIVAEMVAIGFILIFSKQHLKFLFKYGIPILFAIQYLLSFVPETTNSKLFLYRMGNMKDPLNESSMRTRFDSWEQTVEDSSFFELLFGKGVGASGLASSNNRQFLKTDNIFLKLILEIGVIGMFIFLMANLKILWELLFLRLENYSSIIYCCFALISSTMIAGLTSEYLEQFPLKVFYFIAVGMSVGLLKIKKQGEFVCPKNP